MRFRWPQVTSAIVSPSPTIITGSQISLPSVSCSYQGPHQGMPLPIVCPLVKEPSSDKEDKQFQFLAGLIKELCVNPMANFKQAKIKHSWGHMKKEEVVPQFLWRGQLKGCTKECSCFKVGIYIYRLFIMYNFLIKGRICFHHQICLNCLQHSCSRIEEKKL